MSEDVPVSIAQSTFKVFGVDVKCHVLDNGQRIIEADSMNQLLEAMHEPHNQEGDQTSIDALNAWCRGKSA